MLEQLGYRELIKKESVYKFIEGLTNTIDLEINKLKKNTPLSKDKIKIFNDTTNKIVSNAFKEYDKIFINEEDKEIDNEIKTAISGSQILFENVSFCR